MFHTAYCSVHHLPDSNRQCHPKAKQLTAAAELEPTLAFRLPDPSLLSAMHHITAAHDRGYVLKPLWPAAAGQLEQPLARPGKFLAIIEWGV